MKYYIYSIVLTLAFWNAQANNNKPQLVVQLVVDQLRADLIYKHQQQFGKAGFNYLLAHGVNYSNTHHPHANTTTCAGHTTISTGSYPALHGIINNDWYDRKSKQMIYCMQDLETRILPTEHTKITIPGRSPRNIYVSTLSDELVLANKGRSFGLSLKDRSAIALAGHAGKAFWFDTVNGGFITSNYYYNEYPYWVQQWNKAYNPSDFDWNLSRAQPEYQNLHAALAPEFDEDFGQEFPHHIKHNKKGTYFKSLSKTPKADQLTEHFSEQLISEEHLGLTPNKTDYLGISFSAVDAIGHQFGPNSLEAEENLLELDKTLARLFSFIDKEVGLDKTLIILTADHGANDAQNYLKAHHFNETPTINLSKIEQFINTKLRKKYALPEQTLLRLAPPYVYLDHQILEQHQLDRVKVSQFLAQALTFKLGVFRAYTLPVTQTQTDSLSSKVDKMYFPYRSGDIYLVPAPNLNIAHGSPWNYDSYVPLIFAQAHFKPQDITRSVHTTDIAATLSTLLKIKPPSGSVGEPLQEVLN